MERISRKYVESVCEFWGYNLIRHEISGNRKKSYYLYSVTDCDGNFLVQKQDLRWVLMVINTHRHNTKDLGMVTWVCKKCRQINYTNRTCMMCKQPK